MTDSECVEFLQWVLPRIGLRWRGFRRVRKQVRKRLGRRMRALDLEDVAAYRELVEREPGELQVIDRLCRITISRFWRDRAVFDVLAERLLPELGSARVWSAGCASGEEPYSVALAGEPGGVEVSVVGTDADPRLLERARRARYPVASTQEVPDGLRNACFVEEGDEVSVRNRIRERVELRAGDVRQDSEIGPFDVVLCRNLAFTYFADDLQCEVLGRLLRVLRPGGFLVIGGHESLPAGDWPLEAAAGTNQIWRLC